MVSCAITRSNVPIIIQCYDSTTTIQCGTNEEDDGCFTLPSIENVNVSLIGCKFYGGYILKGMDCFNCSLLLSDISVDGQLWSQSDRTALKTVDSSKIGFYGAFNGSRLSIVHSRFTNASQVLVVRGGMSYTFMQNVTITNVSAIKAKVSGVIDVRNVAVVHMDSVTMRDSSNYLPDNDAGADFGGCLILKCYDATITNSDFLRCKSGGSGGGIGLNLYQRGLIENVTVKDSEAKIGGGGLYVNFDRPVSLVIRNVSLVGTKAATAAGFYVKVQYSSNDVSVIKVSNFRVSSSGGAGCIALHRTSYLPYIIMFLQVVDLHGCPSKTYLQISRYASRNTSGLISESVMKNLTVSRTKTLPAVAILATKHSRLTPIEELSNRTSSSSTFVHGMATFATVLSFAGGNPSGTYSLQGAILLRKSTCVDLYGDGESSSGWITSPLQFMIGSRIVDKFVDPVVYNVLMAVSIFVLPIFVCFGIKQWLMIESWTQTMDICRYPSTPVTVLFFIVQGAMYNVVRALYHTPDDMLAIGASVTCTILFPCVLVTYVVCLGHQKNISPVCIHRFHIARHHQEFCCWIRFVLPKAQWVPSAYRHNVLCCVYPEFITGANIALVVHGTAVGILTGVEPESSRGCIGVLIALLFIFVCNGVFILLRQPFLSISTCILKGISNLLVVVLCLMLLVEMNSTTMDVLYLSLGVLCTLDGLCGVVGNLYPLLFPDSADNSNTFSQEGDDYELHEVQRKISESLL